MDGFKDGFEMDFHFLPGFFEPIEKVLCQVFHNCIVSKESGQI
jgi:hypothetical protein